MAREMKDGGIRWIGEIPQNWSIVRGKNILTLLERPVLEHDGIITCFRDGEVTLRSKRREEGFTISLQETGYQGIEPGDLVVHGMDGFAGSIGISDSRGKGTPVLNVLDSSQNKRYLMYFLRCAAYCGLFLSLSTGIRVRTCDTNWNKLKNVLYLKPPFEEQQRIVTFLDSECSRIDSVIEQTRASIEEYKKLKQAVITQAVTKGIRPNREMKDSGIEWIGEIPTDWSISYVGQKIGFEGGSQPPLTSFIHEPKEGYVRLIQNRDYKTDAYITFVPKDSVSKFCDADDVMVGRYGPPMFVMHRGLKGAYNVALMKAIPKGIDREWMSFVLQEYTLLRYVESFSKRAAGQDGVNPIILKKYPLPLPDIKEQIEVANFLHSKTKEIDKIIAKKEQLITELESYKKSLIFEYVTGKKEVPA